jgi:hypothetical protein
MFGDMPKADIELYMDASNNGLAILDPSCDEYIQLQFDEEELAMINGTTPTQGDFSINVREHMCIALALWTWGAKWNCQASGHLVHVKCWSDNMSAVTWSNKLHSGNLLSQAINRSIGLAEAYFNLRVTAKHLPGSSNWMADAASRAWTEPHGTTWANFSTLWKQTKVPAPCRKLYTTFLDNFSPNLWPRHQRRSTAARGNSGVSGVNGLISQDGSLKTRVSIPTNSPYLLSTVGATDGTGLAPETLPAPCSPRSATLRGIIGKISGTASVYSRDTSSRSLACVEGTLPATRNPQSQEASSSGYTVNSISRQPSTESFGGLRCWASSFCSEDRNI